MTAIIGVYGASGCGRGIMPIIRDQYSRSRAVFIDDRASGISKINGHDVIDWAGFLALEADTRCVCLAIAASDLRVRLAHRCHDAGVGLAEARAENVVQMDAVSIGEGACLSHFVTLTSNIRIGRCFHANLYSYVEHDCVIGDFVTFAPKVMCNGNVHIGDHAYIGTGAIIRQGTPDRPLVIGAGAIVGMGAVVTKDVPPGATVVGNPARPLIKG
ncbi:acetyltransferase [Blastomonas sp.]|uniref:acetyltransferase n=1 Tax=Blastomonas sp. TaxID=1909299 RepID=UPI00359377CA